MSLRPLLLASTLIACGAGGAQAFTLNILHLNDFHSRIESVNKYDATCSAEEEGKGECFGGAARLYTEITRLRAAAKAKDENVIVLSAGDVFQGSLFFTAYSGKAELDMMNRLGLDAATFGNHEFDLGPGPLTAFVKGAKFPMVFGTVDASGDAGLAPLDKDPVILDVGGEKVGIVAALTPETAEISTPGPTLRFEDPVESLKAQVAGMQARGVKYILALTHLGTAEDIRVAASVPGIDAIIGGHSHTLFSNTIKGASYPYPLMAEGPEGVRVPIVQAGSYSKYLGDLTLTFDDAGAVTSARGDTALLDASVIPDEGVLAAIKTYAGPINELKAREVAEVAADIDGSRETCRVAECQMGMLVADAMLDRVKAQGVAIALQNGGGLRASIAGGVVTKGDVLAVLPFQNTLSTFNISGAGIIAALENGVSQVEEGGGRFPQVAGLTFRWDPRVAPNEGRVRDVRVAEKGGFVPIDPAKIYAVVTNNFLRNGGDGYAVLRDQGSNAYDFGPNLEDVLADYLSARRGYQPYTDGRIARVD